MNAEYGAPVSIDVDAAPRVSLALQQQGVPFLRRIRLTNHSAEPLDGLTVEVSADPPFLAPFAWRLDALGPGAARDVDTRALLLSPSFLSSQVERENGLLSVRVRRSDDELAAARLPVEVLAPTQWTGVGMLPELLAAFVRPNARVLTPILQDASARLASATGDGSLCGYQKRDPRHATAIAQALWEAVQAAGVGYINPPASFEQGGQKIRTHEAVLGDTLGTCLDLTVLLAALFEQAGLHPLLVVVQGHAFPGVWLTPFELPEAVLDDPLPLRKRVELGEALVVDSSPVTGDTPFAAAVGAAERQLAMTDAFVLAIDVAAARHAAAPVRPLPLDRSGDALAEAVVPSSPLDRGTAVPVLPSDRFRPDAPADAPSRGGTLATRLDRWQQRLLDLSLRNRLLNHREGAKSLPLPRVDIGALEDALAAGDTLALLPRGQGTGLPVDLPDAEREEALRRHALEQQATGRLLVDLAPAELHKHVLELYRLSRSAMEETGASILYLALGFLKWFEAPSSDKARLAPLVLVPVEIVRPSGGAAWQVRAVEEETRVNVTLIEKLTRDFGVDTRGLDALAADASGVDVAAVLHGVRRAVLHQDRWEVLEHASLAPFSFSKFMLWLDLAAKRDQLLENPVVALLAEGVSEAMPSGVPILGEHEVATARAPQDVLTVVDADPTQLRAILAAEDGASFVLQGPPGTGKSQTITNIIAQLLSSGKSVLFVSEKLAALQVVQARLERTGLGPFCLELHSDKATRSAVVKQLAAPFEIAHSHTAEDWARHASRLAETRDILDRHAARLASDTPFGVPLRRVVTELVGLSDVPALPLPARPDAVEALRQLEALAEALEIALREAEPVAGHPFRGVGVGTWTPGWEDRAMVALRGLEDRLTAVAPTLAAARVALRLPDTGDGWDAAAEVAALAQAVLDAPDDVPYALVDPAGIGSRLAEIDAWVARGATLRAHRDGLLEAWRPDLFHLDLDGLLARYQAWASAFFLWAFFALWTARATLGRVRAGPLPAAPQVRDDLALAAWTRDEIASVDALAPQAAAWLGPRWHGTDTDWHDVAALVEWTRRFHAARRAVAARLGDFRPTDAAAGLATDGRVLLVPGSQGHTALTAWVASFAAADAARSHAIDVLALDPATVPGGLGALRDHAAAMLAHRGRLRTWCHVVGVGEQARQAGLGPLLDAVLDGALPRERVQRTLARSLREQWWRARLEADPELAQFSGFRHEEVVQRFRALDERALKLAQAELVRRLVDRLPDLHAPGDEMATVRRQLQLQRRHMPPRKLFATLPTVLKRIKPVVLMSPQSVARFLDPSLDAFDAVVFDEASQIPPWDAIGAIARGRQAIIVGDSKQLPPTSFFDRAEDDDDALDDESLEELESILDEATASNLPQLSLRWHYRSRHESLITFSNRHYYENRLHTFPSADAATEGVGLELRPLPAGSYDRGGSRTNRPEAEAVVAEMERLLDLPDDLRPSVGVVTFSMAQQRLVQDLADDLRQRRPELDRFFAEGAGESVFIKNLENVQGDERDVMLFSIGYGADRHGKLTMSFGPINRKGGERRLNVAITRARSRLIVFSTLDPDQIDLNRTSAVGARHLRAFLRFARDGLRAIDAEALAEGVARFESPFEEQVHTELTAAGYTVHSQIGASGYRIDLAVVDPARPGRFLLGVECDGATYHGSRSARERDRLRQAVLENLGWRIVRVWSTDWWFDRPGQVQRLLEAVEAAKRAPRGPLGVPAPHIPPPPAAPTTSPPARSVAEQLAAAPATPRWPDGVTPWAGLPDVRGGAKDAFHTPSARRQLADTIAQLAARTSPVQRDQAWRHIAQAWGFKGLGKRIAGTLNTVCDAIPHGERPALRDEFLWAPGIDPATWRTFRPSDDGVRAPAEVAPEELANAAAWILSRALSIARDDLVVEVARVFGWQRVGTQVAAAVAEGVDRLVDDGRAVARDGRIAQP